MDKDALQIYDELVALLPNENEFSSPDDPALLDGLHALCLKHGTSKMQSVLDTLETSDDISHRLVATGFRRRMDSVTTVMGFD